MNSYEYIKEVIQVITRPFVGQEMKKVKPEFQEVVELAMEAANLALSACKEDEITPVTVDFKDGKLQMKFHLQAVEEEKNDI